MTDAPETPTDGKGKRTWSPQRRAAFLKSRGARSDGRRGSAPSEIDLIAEEVVSEAVANMTTLAGFAMPFAPYAAVTVAGVPDPEIRDGWIVKSRAQMAGAILLEHAKRDRRVLAAIDRFNRLFTNVEAVEVIAAVGASVAVDVKAIDPHATIKLPGGLEAPILAPVIGDTIEYMDRAREEAEAMRPAPQQGEPYGEVRRRGERAEEIATTRDEGQTVIAGGVEET